MIGLYARVSTQEQAKEGYSIDEQIERLKKYCGACGRSDFKVYVDGGFSGASMNRPDLQKLIKDVELGKVEKVIVYKLDRLSRSQKDTLYLIEDVFLKNGADFESMNERFDTGTSFGRAMIGILAVFAQLEREQIRERMEMGKDGRAKEGKWHGGCYKPIGYDYQGGELIVNDFEALQVREAFNLFLSGFSFNEIDREFSKKGYSHKYGRWTARRIHDVILNPVYCGTIRHGQNAYEGEHEPIIERGIYDKAMEIYERRRASNKRRDRVAQSTSCLGGLIWCKRCGARYGTHRSKVHGYDYDYYTCYSRRKTNRNMVKDPDCENKVYRMEELEKIVFGEIKKLATDTAYFDQITMEKVTDDKMIRQKAIVAEIGKIDGQRGRLIDLYALGSFLAEELQEKVANLEDKKKRLQEQLDELTAGSPDLDREQARRMVRSFSDVLERGEIKEIRLLLESLIERIDIDGEDIEIHWRFT